MNAARKMTTNADHVPHGPARLDRSDSRILGTAIESEFGSNHACYRVEIRSRCSDTHELWLTDLMCKGCPRYRQVRHREVWKALCRSGKYVGGRFALSCSSAVAQMRERYCCWRMQCMHWTWGRGRLWRVQRRCRCRWSRVRRIASIGSGS